MRINHRTERRARIEILPLIDVVFLLLVFFIYAMLSMTVHHGLPVDLPVSSASEIDKSRPISVTLMSDGSVWLDKERVGVEGLSLILEERSKADKKKEVLVFADKTIPYQKLFHVLDQIRLAGLSRISLQAETEG